ncbi:hypothetical protein EST38_g10150 [Candolleomyces aberdarensis]|uniref:F-box domain-containing protein n=1 Tax=Candolleomyces aberdarensis TaxID=2316362 RepID=A0A4Q2DAK5_9AGAR|nr:hypothetical protein EST38_g10150 [Candolleomyces aberdarensis]
MCTSSTKACILRNAPSWVSSPVEIHHVVLSFLSVTQLVSLGKTSRYNYALVKEHIRARVVDLLSQWSLPNSFSEFMNTHNIVFSGSAVLALLEPECVTPNDLDAYVPLGALEDVHTFLSQHTFYVKFNNLRVGLPDAAVGYISDSSADTGINDVIYYRHSKTNAVLNIIETAQAVPTTAIFKFHSTFVMNYLTSNALVCAYPKMTADHVGLVNTPSPNLTFRTVRCLVKYGVRGFNALDRSYDWKNQVHNCHSFPYCGRCRRVVGDRFTLCIAFSAGIGAVPNVIDPKLSWTLSSRYDCNPLKRVAPEKGSVSPGCLY